jgi:TRAP-type C4-dicarboxylate transport system substrate-binding protein
VQGVWALVVVELLTVALAARADEPITLRMAAIAPDGTGWARELRAFARDVESGTQGAVRMKWYLGGVAGDETAALDRIRRNQLDGAAGALFCATLAPTLGVTRVAGLVQSRDEALYLLNHLRPRLDDEFKRAGFVSLVVGNFGNDVIFLRRRVDNFAELKKTPMWIWDADVLLRKQMTTMGLTMVPASVDQLAGMYDAGQIDGMFVIPTAALAFQWATRAHYFIELRGSALAGCVTVSLRFTQLRPAAGAARRRQPLRHPLRGAGAARGRAAARHHAGAPRGQAAHRLRSAALDLPRVGAYGARQPRPAPLAPRRPASGPGPSGRVPGASAKTRHRALTSPSLWIK